MSEDIRISLEAVCYLIDEAENYLKDGRLDYCKDKLLEAKFDLQRLIHDIEEGK